MQRRLTAILSADLAGYSALMEADEAGTHERLKVNRSQVFDPCVAAHGGRLVKFMGDGALVEFSSVIAAVKCALAIQEATTHAEPERAEATRIRYRIGINLGEVIVEGDDIYGEGAIVAARLQALAPVAASQFRSSCATRWRRSSSASSRTWASTPRKTSSARFVPSPWARRSMSTVKAAIRERRAACRFAFCRSPT